MTWQEQHEYTKSMEEWHNKLHWLRQQGDWTNEEKAPVILSRYPLNTYVS